MTTIDERLTDIETDISHLQKMLGDLNDELIKQWDIIDRLVKENKALKETIGSNIRPISEETPPPHY